MSTQENDTENFDSELIDDSEIANLAEGTSTEVPSVEESSLEDIFSEEIPFEEPLLNLSDDILAESGSDLEENLETKPQITEEKAADLEAKLAEAQDSFLRKAADFENYRKRMNIEKQRAIEFANESLLLDIIPIIDDFERAIQSVEASEELNANPKGKAVLEGIFMIEKRLLSQLESKWGLKRLDSTGEIFNPDCHEAIMVEKSPEVKEAVVKEDFIKAYMLKDRIIRAAKVNVLMPENNI